MSHGGRAVGADHVADRIDLADRGEELVAEALPLRSALDEAGDVVEVDRLVNDFGGAQRLGDPLQALVRDADDGDVRLDRGERVVARLRTRGGEGVEESRLPGVGHADDPDLPPGGAIRPMAAARTAAASTSDG